MELVNKMRQYKDPLLDDFDKEMNLETASSKGNTPEKKSKQKKEKKDSDDEVDSDESSEGSGSGGESSSEEEGLDIDFPKDNMQDILQFIQRDIVNMQNKEDAQKRKFALIKLYKVFVLAKNKAPNRIYQELLPEIQKPLFKRLSDPIEKTRELACLVIKEFFSRCDDLTLSIPYLLPMLVERLRAENLEGTDYLDEKLKPVQN